MFVKFFKMTKVKIFTVIILRFRAVWLTTSLYNGGIFEQNVPNLCILLRVKCRTLLPVCVLGNKEKWLMDE